LICHDFDGPVMGMQIMPPLEMFYNPSEMASRKGNVSIARDMTRKSYYLQTKVSKVEDADNL
jgi:hypothetical protein